MNNMAELVGYTVEDMTLALNAVEDSLPIGGKATLRICSSSMPADEDLAELFLNATAAGFHLSYPVAKRIKGVPTTELILTKGSPQWALLIPLIPTVLIVGLIAFGLARIEEISKALLPLIIVGAVGLVALALIVRKPAEKYLERGGVIPRLAATSKKAPAAS